MTAGTLWSFGDLTVRYMVAPHTYRWQYLFFRGVTIAVVLCIYLIAKDGKRFPHSVNPNDAKAGALLSQGTKGEAVAIYCDPMVTLDLECSGFPEGWKT